MLYTIISKPGCPHCVRAKAMLDARGFTYSEDVCDTDEKVRAFKDEGYLSFPMVFLGQSLIGTADQLAVHLKGLPQEDDF